MTRENFSKLSKKLGDKRPLMQINNSVRGEFFAKSFLSLKSYVKGRCSTLCTPKISLASRKISKRGRLLKNVVKRLNHAKSIESTRS